MFIFLIFLNSLIVKPDLLLLSLQVLDICLQGEDMLLLISMLLFSISDIIVFVLDLNSEVVLSFLELGVLAVELIKIEFKISDSFLKPVLLVSQLLDLSVVVVEISSEISVLVSRFADL